MEAQTIMELPNSPPLTVGIAINGKKKSKYVVHWALEKFIPEGQVAFKLIHVRSPISSVPTPMGSWIPISQVREDVALAYRREMDLQAKEMILPYRNVFIRRKLQFDVIMAESEDIANAIAAEVAIHNITQLVIGITSPAGFFQWKSEVHDLSSRIAAYAPNFCTVYVISRGNLSSIRPSDMESIGSVEDEASASCGSRCSSSRYSSSMQSDAIPLSAESQARPSATPLTPSLTTLCTSDSCLHSPATLRQRSHAFPVVSTSIVNAGATNSFETSPSSLRAMDIEGAEDATVSCPTSSSRRSTTMNEYNSWGSDQGSTTDMYLDGPSSDGQANVNFELEKLRIELRHAREIYAVAQHEAIYASVKLNDLNKQRLEGSVKLTELCEKEETSKELARRDKERCEAMVKEAEYMRECAEIEAAKRRETETKANCDFKRKLNLENILVSPVQKYQKFSWDEIEEATSLFSERLRIGMGSYGTVYRCSLHHTKAAVKVLHAKDNGNAEQFHRELEVLSKVCHPHLLTLLGACPERGCLVYEYMENGSLEERLQRKNGTPPIPWYDRYRIAWEVASALAFLHNFNPTPIIHRDLKPSNILLDRNLVSKIGDVGLSTMLHSDASSAFTMHKETAPVGTLCYIDPEYQRTGLMSPTSDVYSFGMIILQLLTAKPAMALTHLTETAIEEGRLVELLDHEAGNWPLEETEKLAALGLRCVELRRRKRPNLRDEVLPVLEKLKEVADAARDAAASVVTKVSPTPPSHFICPILKDVMSNPCVAADGYTYDRKAIEKWLEGSDLSPMTNLPLTSKNLLPNYSLLSAIMDWTTTNH